MNRHNEEARQWLLAVVLAAPAVIPLIGHYIGYSRIGLYPTGFIQPDMPYYMANARELTDSGGFNLTYGNPFSPDYATPRIYFQPLTLLLAILQRVTRADPGILFALVGLAGATVCVRLAIALFDRFAPKDSSGRLLGLVIFIWGGGLLVIAGLLFSLIHGQHAQVLFFYDPSAGWWFLNLGRNFVYSTEAIYHAIFFGAILLLLTRRYASALATLALMSISHPFTGIQLLSIVIAWSVVELFLLRSGTVPLWFVGACLALAVAHVAYYLVYLSSFAEHRLLQEQWTLPLLLPFESFVLGHVLVGGLVVWRMRSLERARTVLKSLPNRLLLAWFVVTLLLVYHDLFIRPMQPLHFTRGYLWIPLFLLGLPTMMAMLARIRELRPPPIAALATVAVVGILLSDNAIWLGIRGAQAVGVAGSHFGLPFEPLSTVTSRAKSAIGFGLTQDELQVFRVMNDSSNRGFVVVSADPIIGYLATVYSPLRSWRSHPANTPLSERRDAELHEFFGSGRVLSEWDRLPILFVFRKEQPWSELLTVLGRERATVILENSAYVVIRRPTRVSRPQGVRS